MNLTLLFSIACSLFDVGPAPIGPSPIVRGDYVEARTASVFAGPCHFNGEVVTTGCDAILAWNVRSGSYDHVDLSGLRAMAVVTSDANLADASTSRRSEIAIDSSATPAQAAAFVDAVRSHDAASLGQITGIRREPIVFIHYARQYRVSAAGFAAITAQGMPNDECCKQPNLVWYSPLVHLDWRKVGYTSNAAYTAGTLTDPWQRADENSAFYGAFSITP
jgi:hypothetical protein